MAKLFFGLVIAVIGLGITGSGIGPPENVVRELEGVSVMIFSLVVMHRNRK
jgi:hypothetical protein